MYLADTNIKFFCEKHAKSYLWNSISIRTKSAVTLKKTESVYLTEENTAFHCDLHAADVAQSLWAVLVEMRVDRFCDPMATTTSLLSAIVHDMDGFSPRGHYEPGQAHRGCAHVGRACSQDFINSDTDGLGELLA